MRRTVEERLLERSERDPETGCLRWTGSISAKGYGHMNYKGTTTGVHRLAHEVWVGPIPEGYTVDHVYERGCRYRDCIEPAHLEAVTHVENVRRSLLSSPRTRREFCPHGHPMTEENTVHRMRRGYDIRQCRQCKKDWHKRYMRELRAS